MAEKNNKKELIRQAKINRHPCARNLKTIRIIPRRKLHDSGYKMMYVIGLDYNYKPYMISSCSDSIDFTNYYTKQPFHGIQMDVDNEGVISLWSLSNSFKTMDHDCSTIIFDVLQKEDEINDKS